MGSSLLMVGSSCSSAFSSHAAMRPSNFVSAASRHTGPHMSQVMRVGDCGRIMGAPCSVQAALAGCHELVCVGDMIGVSILDNVFTDLEGASTHYGCEGIFGTFVVEHLCYPCCSEQLLDSLLWCEDSFADFCLAFSVDEEHVDRDFFNDVYRHFHA